MIKDTFDLLTSPDILGPGLQLAGGSQYLAQCWMKKEKPARTTWALWSIIGSTIFLSQLNQGVEGGSLFLSGVTALIAIGVLGSSLFRHKDSSWEFTNFDKACGAVSLLALISLFLANNPNLAIGLGIVADLTAAAPGLRQAFEEPNKVTIGPWITGMAGSAIVCLGLPQLTWENAWAVAAAPIYYTALNAAFVLLNARQKSPTNQT